MTTIADAFLEDFEDEVLEDEMGVADDEVDVIVETINMDDSDDENVDTNEQVDKISNLLGSSRFVEHMKTTEEYYKTDPSKSFVSGRAEDSPEYRFILKSNELIVEIDDDIVAVHKYIRDIYAARFPELEQTLVHPVEYAKVVRKIGNRTDIQGPDLQDCVSEHQKLTITIAASATSGKPLQNTDMHRVFRGCDVIIELDEAKKKIYDYVESRMRFVAPNLSALVGSEIASQLMGLAGGLVALTKIPSCNIQVLGSQKRETSGYSVASANPNVGLLSKCQIVAETPQEFRMRALRQVAAKVVLVARVDAYQDTPSDGTGIKFFSDIKAKIEKWQEAPPPKPPKPLPIPEEKQRPKRGGKRYRKMKEKYKVTEMQKMKNRIGFNVAEEENEHGEGFGMLGQSGVGGQLRVLAKDNKEMKKLEKLNKINLERQQRKRRRQAAQRGEISGTATSLAFTPVQGMELVNPERQLDRVKRANEATASYFGSLSFSKVKKSR